jgi:imidazolonepropionase-like amidohydrolase
MVANIADGVDEVRRAVRTQLRRGADAIKVMAGGGVASPTDRLESPQYQPDELGAAVAEAEAAGTYVLAHAYTPVAIRNAVQAGGFPHFLRTSFSDPRRKSPTCSSSR